MKDLGVLNFRRICSGFATPDGEENARVVLDNLGEAGVPCWAGTGIQVNTEQVGIALICRGCQLIPGGFLDDTEINKRRRS